MIEGLVEFASKVKPPIFEKAVAIWKWTNCLCKESQLKWTN